MTPGEPPSTIRNELPASCSACGDLGLSDLPPELLSNSVIERFDLMADTFPDRPAICTTSTTLSYAMLRSLTEQIALALTSAGADHQVPIGLLLSNDVAMVGSMLGVLRARGFYVPLDPSFPVGRLSHMIADAGSQLILVNSQTEALALAARPAETSILNVDLLGSDKSSIIRKHATPDSPAYIMYTSGSTGRPKAVIQSHRNILHNSLSTALELELSPSDRLLSVASYATGNAAANVYTVLLNGACFCPFDIKSQGMLALSEWLDHSKISVYRSSSTVFRAFADSLRSSEHVSSIRMVRLASETVSITEVDLFKKFFSERCLLINELSSTEAMHISRYLIDRSTVLDGPIVPVGWAVRGKRILVVDENGCAVTQGDVGEISIVSEYLSPGYWNMPELSDSMFIACPCGSTRMYRTGDLGRLRADGCLEHLGRKNSRVNARGYRVELSEVELAVRQLQGVAGAAVAAWGADSDQVKLAAYIVPASKASSTAREFRRQLEEILPGYMVPSAIVIVDALPLTDNGKIDRRALPEPDWSHPMRENAYLDPRSDLEVLVANIWTDILGIDRIGIYDNFFELGGNSLLAMQLVTRIRDSLGVDLPLSTIFGAPTVSALTLVLLAQELPDD
jgi:amino acid adenylation domain-containing protein